MRPHALFASVAADAKIVVIIPDHSAILDGSEIHPVQQYHGSLFVDNDMKMRLKLELTRRPPADALPPSGDLA